MNSLSLIMPPLFHTLELYAQSIFLSIKFSPVMQKLWPPKGGKIFVDGLTDQPTELPIELLIFEFFVADWLFFWCWLKQDPRLAKRCIRWKLGLRNKPAQLTDLTQLWTMNIQSLLQATSRCYFPILTNSAWVLRLKHSLQAYIGRDAWTHIC